MSAHAGIVLASDFTVDPIVDSLVFWVRQMGWADDVRIAPYNQVIQTLLDPGGLFATNREGVNVVLVRERWLASDAAAELRQAVETYRGAPLVVVICPGGSGEAFTVARDSVYLLPAAEIARRYPVADPFDPHAEELGDIPYTPLYFAALGTAVARVIHALRMRPYKVIALDCDNTLWQGTCGEDGPENVTIDGPRRELQEFMRAQRDAGMLLAMASKNNEEDVADTFRAHPEMPLSWDDFIAKAINWDSKGESIAEMAGALGLGLDSFIFVDDNAKEIGEVQAACPVVLGLTLPHDEARIPGFLEHIWAFDHLRVTKEDQLRNESYRQQLERVKVEKRAGTLGGFIEQLRVEVHIQPLRQEQVARVAQLTQRTNQMNTTLVRRSEGDVVRLIGASPVACLTVDVTDRFGSYGLVGAMFLSYEQNAVRVENMLLSCRALGRGVEQRMLAEVGRLALGVGRSLVEVAFVEGPRNAPARKLVSGLPGFGLMDAAVCAALRYEPASKVELIAETPKTTSGNERAFRDYGRIARDLSRPSQVLDAIRAEQLARAGAANAAEPGGSELERQLAEIWADVLRIPTPGRDADFFDLGGHSLIAVQLLSRVRQELSVELPLDLVYTGKLTVASMAAAVELAQADPDEVNRLLAEIEELSEEELRALLESE